MMETIQQEPQKPLPFSTFLYPILPYTNQSDHNERAMGVDSQPQGKVYSSLLLSTLFNFILSLFCSWRRTIDGLRSSQLLSLFWSGPRTSRPDVHNRPTAHFLDFYQCFSRSPKPCRSTGHNRTASAQFLSLYQCFGPGSKPTPPTGNNRIVTAISQPLSMFCSAIFQLQTQHSRLIPL
jgi:hypothetical protein